MHHALSSCVRTGAHCQHTQRYYARKRLLWLSLKAAHTRLERAVVMSPASMFLCEASSPHSLSRRGSGMQSACFAPCCWQLAVSSLLSVAVHIGIVRRSMRFSGSGDLALPPTSSRRSAYCVTSAPSGSLRRSQLTWATPRISVSSKETAAGSVTSASALPGVLRGGHQTMLSTSGDDSISRGPMADLYIFSRLTLRMMMASHSRAPPSAAVREVNRDAGFHA